jgi:hypothetical protein
VYQFAMMAVVVGLAIVVCVMKHVYTNAMQYNLFHHSGR